MRILLLLILILCHSCSIENSYKESDPDFSFSTKSSDFVVHNSYVFQEQFYYVDSFEFEGERICTLLTNGVVDSVFHEEIAFKHVPAPSDSQVVDPSTGKLQQVLPVREEFYTNGVLVAVTTLYIQQRTDGFYILFWRDTKGVLRGVEEAKQQRFPMQPVSGYLYKTDGTQNIGEKRNSWSTQLFSPMAFRYNAPFTGSYTMIEGAFALEAIGQPAYVINETGFRDGIDVKSYHQTEKEYSVNGVSHRAITRIQETDYYFKQWGLAEKQMYVVVENITGKERLQLTKDHYIMQQVF